MNRPDLNAGQQSPNSVGIELAWMILEPGPDRASSAVSMISAPTTRRKLSGVPGCSPALK